MGSWKIGKLREKLVVEKPHKPSEKCFPGTVCDKVYQHYILAENLSLLHHCREKLLKFKTEEVSGRTELSLQLEKLV